VLPECICVTLKAFGRYDCCRPRRPSSVAPVEFMNISSLGPISYWLGFASFQFLLSGHFDSVFRLTLKTCD